MRRPAVPDLDRRTRWRLVALVAGVVCLASVVDVGPASGGAGPPVGDKLLHVLAYATLATALSYATAGSGHTPRRRAALVVGGAAAYGLGVELLQAAIPYRTCSLLDALANGLGASLGWLAAERILRQGDSPPE